MQKLCVIICFCYKSNAFLNLEQRKRLTMLSQMSNTLVSETNKYLKPVSSRGSSVDENALSCKEKGLLNNVRSLLMKRTRSKSFLTPNSSLDMKRPSLLSPNSPQQQPMTSQHSNHSNFHGGSLLGVKFKNQYLSTGKIFK